MVSASGVYAQSQASEANKTQQQQQNAAEVVQKSKGLSDETLNRMQPPIDGWHLDLEYQHFNVFQNSLQRPDTIYGTRFNTTYYSGTEINSGRLMAFAPLNLLRQGDELRMVYAPIEQSGTQTPKTPILYDGAVYRATMPLSVLYKFNTYRLTYDVPIFTNLKDDGWEFRIGGTVALRDAKIQLSQYGTNRDLTNIGPIPLLYFSMTKNLWKDWRLLTEFDAFPAPCGGGLFDGSVKVAYDITKNASLTAGYRYEIGAAVDKTLYNYLNTGAVVFGINLKP